MFSFVQQNIVKHTRHCRNNLGTCVFTPTDDVEEQIFVDLGGNSIDKKTLTIAVSKKSCLTPQPKVKGALTSQATKVCI